MTKYKINYTVLWYKTDSDLKDNKSFYQNDQDFYIISNNYKTVKDAIKHIFYNIIDGIEQTENDIIYLNKKQYDIIFKYDCNYLYYHFNYSCIIQQ